MTHVYDFIIVGAGPAGISLATKLCRSGAQPSVLLLEVGEESEQIADRIAGERLTFWENGGTHLNHGYKTVPQNEIGGREISYARGKGLGGSTLINMSVWDYGSKEDFNEWAKLVGDDVWNWEHTLARFKQMENYHNETPTAYEKYVKLGGSSHGNNGPIDVSLPKFWPPGLKEAFEAWSEYGAPLNPDINSDKHIGFGMAPATTYQGLRITAASAYLKEKPDNLTIKTNSKVARVIFEAKKAVGVELSDKTRYISTKDTILSAGSIDTPKILLLSGVGDSEQLRIHDIPVTVHRPSIGLNLRDHVMVRMAAAIKPGSFNLPDPIILQSAREQWLRDRSGPLSGDMAVFGIGYLKLPITSYPEYATLDRRTQALLAHPEVPAFEQGFGVLPAPQLDHLILHTTNILMHSQSLGSISLKSADPKDSPNIDLNVLAHPYDCRIMIEALKETYGFLQKSTFPIENIVEGPKSDSDVDLLEYIKDHITTSWHALGTVKMGNEGEDGACVSSEFKVIGLENLRVVDLSVCPVLPSIHTQSVAYLMGDIAADKIIKEYELDKKSHPTTLASTYLAEY